LGGGVQMRASFLALVLSAGLGLTLSAQAPVRPPSSVTAAAEELSKDLALRKYGPELADYSKLVMGTLNAKDSSFFRRWDRVVQLWKKEKGAGASPLLAEGVLFDCLSRMHGILTGVLHASEQATPNFLDLAAQRPKRASQAFRAALKIDPQLTEARFRDARIRAGRDADARTQLEQFSERKDVFAYLASISRAETARALHDSDGARVWYSRALTLVPDAPAPHFGLAALSPDIKVPFEALAPADLYYTYPCTILTEAVGAELLRRMNPPVKK
jgi:hypothetical protein